MKRIATAALAATMLVGVAQAAEMTIFKQPGFAGGRVTVRNEARDLAPLGVTDQASSLVIRSGRWQVCTQPDFQGDCRVLESGKYARLDPSLNHRIESVREVRNTARRGEGRYARRPYESYSAPGYQDRTWRGERDSENRREYGDSYGQHGWGGPYSGG